MQGPPGTGKTRTLLAFIEVMVNSRPVHPFTPILACADTNAAVDNLVEGLVARRINVVRLGQPAKVLYCALSVTHYVCLYVCLMLYVQNGTCR